MPNLTRSALAAMIDHTCLKADATRTDIERLCEEAKTHGFASVCVQPYRVNVAANLVHDTEVSVCTVIGFPLGASASAVKAMEVIRALADGAHELDVVLNIGALKDGNDEDVAADLRAVVRAAQGRPVKVILETSLLTQTEIVRACEIAKEVGAQFVKTSTGFSTGGATVEHVKLMRQTVGAEMGVKASGGIRDRKFLLDLIEAGATRIGTSSGVSLLNEESGSGPVGY